ncbi:MAG: hypothetical protein Q8P90_01930 [bacterium]|nr:hypothetical protein [bacterium]
MELADNYLSFISTEVTTRPYEDKARVETSPMKVKIDGVELMVVKGGTPSIIVELSDGRRVMIEGADVQQTARIVTVNYNRHATYWSGGIQQFPDCPVQRVEVTAAAGAMGVYLALVYAGLGDLLSLHHIEDLAPASARGQGFWHVKNAPDLAAYLRSMCRTNAPIEAVA